MSDDYKAAAEAMRAKYGKDALREIDRIIADHVRGGDPEILDYWRQVRRAYK